MSIDKEPLSPILVRFQQDLQLNRRGERTQQSYVRNVRKFAEFLRRDPDTASEDDLRNYLLFIKNDRHWSSSTINVAQQALKKFFTLSRRQSFPQASRPAASLHYLPKSVLKFDSTMCSWSR